MMNKNVNEIIKFTAPDLPINIKQIDFIKNQSTRDVHYHNEIEIIRVTKGSVLCKIENEDLVLTEGKILFINKRALHKIHFYKEKASCTFLQINIDKYRSAVIPESENHLNSFLCQSKINAYAVFDNNNEISYLFDEICTEFGEKKRSYEIYLISKIFNIIAFMCRNKLASYDNAYTERKNIEKILPAIKYAEENYNQKIYLHKVCKEINMDKFYFCKLFKKITGSRFMDYVIYLRLIHAENMLSSTENTISETAYLCGFNSIQYFNKIFKTYKGCSPREFRKIKKILL